MSRILLCWELGGGYGHLSHLLALAQPLRAMGHECFLALKDLSRATSLFDPNQYHLLQAPVWLPTSVNIPAPVSYADILLHFGYLRADCLTGLVAAWRGLYTTVQPDLLIFNHAPTANFAARDLDVPKVCIDTGFSAPPAHRPLPPLRWWQDCPHSRLLEAETRVLVTTAAVATQFGLPEIEAVHQLCAADLQFVCSFPELDHYPDRGTNTAYRGPVFSLDAPGAAQWPLGDGPKVFAYVNQSYPGFEGLIQALTAQASPVLVHTPGLSEADHKRLRAANLEFSRAPVSMRTIRSQANLVISHSPGTGAAALLAGIPVLQLPTQLEQQMFAKRVEQLGTGLQVPLDKQSSAVRPHLRQLLNESSFAQQAKAFAERYADFDPDITQAAMAKQCANLLGSNGNKVNGTQQPG